MVSLAMAKATAAFAVPAIQSGRGAMRQLWGNTGVCGLRRVHQAGGAQPRASFFHSGLVLAMAGSSDAGGLGDKNITVGPEGINFDEVGAVGNLRMAGQGFNAPAQKAGPDVGANFKVKSQSKLANEIDQDSAKQKDAGSAYNLENLVEFPCLFQLKVLGYRQGEFVEDILDLIGNTVGVNGRELKHSHRDKGQWRSITVSVPVESAQQLYKVYEAIDTDPRVKYKF